MIDTAHQYTITRAQADDWNKAGPVPGSLSFGDPSGWRPPYPLTVTEIDRAGSRPEQGNASGWTFRHQDFLSRGDWVTDLFPRASGNGKLVLLVGIDKRKLPTHGVFFGDAVSDGAYGNLTLDLFESSPQNEVAAVDLDCGMASVDCWPYVTIVNSRWFAIALQKNLGRVVLFDFGEQQ